MIIPFSHLNFFIFFFFLKLFYHLFFDLVYSYNFFFSLEEASTIVDDINEPFIPDEDLMFDDDQVSPIVPKTKKPGKKKDEVWKYFIEDTRKSGHSPSICKFCDDFKTRGRLSEMMAHLAL